jgi:hypothetical protein
VVFIAQSSVAAVGFLLLCAAAATITALLSIGFSFTNARHRWFVLILAIPSFVFGFALTIAWFTSPRRDVLFPVVTASNFLIGSAGIGRWIVKQAR